MKKNQPATNTLEAHEKRFAIARNDLLIVIILTVANIVMMFIGSDSMMLFSASIPYFAVGMGYYGESVEILVFGIIIAVICLALYLVCWIFSKKKYQWLIVATVLFVIDSAAMIGLYSYSGEFESGIMDMIIHAFVLYYLIVGVITGKKLQALKAESALGEGIATNDYFTSQEGENPYSDHHSTYIRRADTEVKSRVLAEADYKTHHIVYRRVKRVNELVIDGYVYDEIEMLVETPHTLTAVINGELVNAGMKQNSRSFISVEGNEIAGKLRLI